MTWLYGAVGLFIGLTIGWAMHAYVVRELEAENRHLRIGLSWIRSTLGMTPGYRPLVQYIDRLLAEEAA